jgi:hypothetical protein
MSRASGAKSCRASRCLSAGMMRGVTLDAWERGRAHQCGFGVLFGLLLVASAQTATRLCARDFGYQPALGPSLVRLYPPRAIAVDPVANRIHRVQQPVMRPCEGQVPRAALRDE